METQYWWWLLALGLGIAEILTGTFYLIVLALACVLGGVAALAGLPSTWQLLITALCAFGGWGLLLRNRSKGGASAAGEMRLDVGQQLRIDEWLEPRRTQVRYRGAQWPVELAPDAEIEVAVPGQFVITQVEAGRLIVAPVR